MTVFIIVLVTLALDQLTKLIIVNNFHVNESIPLIENVFHLTYVKNYGAAFGILTNQRLFFILVTFIVIVALLIIYWQVDERGIIVKLPLGLGLGGAIGNLIDRLRLGYVIDFLDFRIWPVFNIADSAIVVGVGFFFYWAIILDGME